MISVKQPCSEASELQPLAAIDQRAPEGQRLGTSKGKRFSGPQKARGEFLRWKLKPELQAKLGAKFAEGGRRNLAPEQRTAVGCGDPDHLNMIFRQLVPDRKQKPGREMQGLAARRRLRLPRAGACPAGRATPPPAAPQRPA